MSVIKRNVLWLLLSQGATWIVAIVTMIVVPPILGERLFGELAFAMAYAGIFELVAIFGCGRYLTKSIARQPELRGQFVLNALALKLTMSILVGILAAAIGIVLGFSDQRMTLVLIFNVGIVLAAMDNAVNGGLFGSQQMGRPAFWDVVRTYLGAAIGITILAAGGGITAYAMAISWVVVVPLVGKSWALRTDLVNAGGLRLPTWWRLMVGGAPFFALAGLNLLQGAIDVPMLEAMSGTEPVGWYTLAIRWVSMPALLAVVAATAFFPALSAEGTSVNRAFTSMTNRCLHFVSLVAIPASVGIALIADRFIGFLYRGDFAEAVPVMRLLSLEIPLAAINVVVGSAIVAADRQRAWVLVALAAAIFNPAVNLVAIPWAEDRFGNAAIGAALTTVLTEVIMLVGAMKLRPSGVLDRTMRRTIGRIVVSSLAMIPVVLLLRDAPLVVAVIAGGATYGVCAVALHAVRADDLQQLRSQIVRHRSKAEPEPDEESAPHP